MDNGSNRPVKKDNIPDSTNRKPSKVLFSAVKTIVTGKLPPDCQGGSSSRNSSKVAPQ